MTRAIWIAGLIGLALVILFLATRTNDDRGFAPPPPPVSTPVPKPEENVERIQCPVCDGYGYVMEQTRAGPRRRVCLFCGGKGGKELRISPGNVKCPDCYGFGKMQTRGASSVVCPRCGGRGYIKTPFQPSP